MSKKIWNCLPWNSGYFETVCPGQPENLQNCLSKHKVNIFRAMLKNIIDSKNCLFYIFFELKCGRTSAHIVCICLVQNCLSQAKISETVYLGSETVCPKKDRQTDFYSPLYTLLLLLIPLMLRILFLRFLHHCLSFKASRSKEAFWETSAPFHSCDFQVYQLEKGG